MSFKIVSPGQAMSAAPTPEPIPAPVADPHNPASAVPPAEPIAAEPAKAEPKESDLSPKFAELARKEQTIRKAATTLKQQRTQLDTDRAALAQSHVPKERLQKDPLAALAEAGHTPDKLVEMLIAAGAKPPVESPAPASDPRIEALQAEIAELKKSKQTDSDSAYTAALKQIERDATKLVESQPDYPTIKDRGAVKDVVELVEKTFKATGEIMSVAEASKLVEAELIEEGLKWANLKSVQDRLKPTEPPAPKAVDPEAPPVREPKRYGMPAKIVSRSVPAKTLTHSLSSTKPMTARDRALAILTGQK